MKQRVKLERLYPFFQKANGQHTHVTHQASFTPEQIKRGAACYNDTVTDAVPLDLPGVSACYQDEGGAVFHTYSCYARGLDMMNATYQYLDLVPKGRDEEGHENSQYWVRHHDRYEG